MPGKRTVLFLLGLVPLFLFMSAEQGAKPSALLDFLGKSVNFFLLFGTLAFLGAKPIKAFLGRRTMEIKAELEEAKESRKTAELKLAEIQERLSSLEAEAAGLKKTAEEEGRISQVLILEQSRREVERIKSLAGQEMDLQIKAGIKEIRAYAAGLATKLAEERIRRKLTPDAHKRLIDKSIERLDKLYEKSNLD